MTPSHEALRELAEKATPGPWRVYPEGRWFVQVDDAAAGGIFVATASDERNTAFIAAASPTAILALLADLDAAERDKLEVNRQIDAAARATAASTRILCEAVKGMTLSEEDRSRWIAAMTAAFNVLKAAMSSTQEEAALQSTPTTSTHTRAKPVRT